MLLFWPVIDKAILGHGAVVSGRLKFPVKALAKTVYSGESLRDHGFPRGEYSRSVKRRVTIYFVFVTLARQPLARETGASFIMIGAPR